LSADEDEQAKRENFKEGYNEGYKRGYEKGYGDANEKNKQKTARTTVQFLRIICECNTINFHPIFENKLIINEDEERRCHGCGKIIPRDDILTCYSRLQTK
jgi:hypothetical protein